MSLLTKWSSCQLEEDKGGDLEPSPDFVDDSEEIDGHFLTSTQQSQEVESPHLFQLSQSPVVKKRRKVQEKFTKKDAVEIMDKIGEYAETAQYLLESMGTGHFQISMEKI